MLPPGVEGRFEQEGAHPMNEMNERAQAAVPEDLGRFFIGRANSGDVEGLVALYEPGAVLALPDGGTATGADAIRQFYEELLANKPTFVPPERSETARPALRNGDWALTSTRIPTGVTTELAHRQPDGTWLWTIDQPNVLGD
jgi:ketosteroid isomerase-like protein